MLAKSTLIGVLLVIASLLLLSTATAASKPWPTEATGQRKIDYEDESYKEDFSKAIVNLISKVAAKALGDEKGDKLSDRVWKAKETLPGFDTAIVLGDGGDLEVGSSFLNVYYIDRPEEAFKRFVIFVNTSLMRSNALLPNVPLGADGKPEYGYWFGWPSAKNEAGQLIDQTWEHSRLHVTVSMMRQPELASLDRKITVWRYTILIALHSREVGTTAVPPAGQSQTSQRVRPQSTLPSELRVRLDTAIVRYVETSTRFGVPLWGGGLTGRIKGVVGKSNIGGPNVGSSPGGVPETLSPEGWACSDNMELLIRDYTLEIPPGGELECSGSASPVLTIQFEYGAFTLQGDWVEIRAGTLAFVFQQPGRGVPYLFMNGQWMRVEHAFHLVSADVSQFGPHLILVNKEKYPLRKIKLEITSDTGHHYWLHIPGLAPGLVLNLPFGDFKDGGGAEFAPQETKMARLMLFCEVNGELGRTGWDW